MGAIMRELYEEKKAGGWNKKKQTLKPGDKFGYLTFISYIPLGDGGHRRGWFKCICGREVSRIIYQMKKPTVNPKSCGCMLKYSPKRGKKMVSVDNDMANKFLSGKL